MALKSIQIGPFFGVKLRQQGQDPALDWAEEGWNVDTEHGGLKRAGGFSRVYPTALTGSPTLFRLHLWPKAAGLPGCIALRSDGVLHYKESENVWESLWGFQTAGEAGSRFDFLPVRMGDKEKLLIASGTGPLRCWEENTDSITLFGTKEKLSDPAVNYLALYFGRLFAAGDAAHPARLYWSQTPGDGRTLDNWGTAEAGADVSGGHMEVGTDSEPITGLKAMSNQLVIFKKDRLYRLLGDRPSNFRIQPVEAPFRQPLHTACLLWGDRLFFLTEDGLYYYDGQTLCRTPHSRDISPLLERADLSACTGAACGNRLYFTLKLDPASPYNDAMAEYDLERDCFLLRRGFQAVDLQSCQGKLYLLTGDGSVCAFDGSGSYNGAPIEAVWTSHWTALGSLYADKRILELTAAGRGMPLMFSVEWEDGSDMALLPLSIRKPLATARLRGGGRRLRLSFLNGKGGDFCLESPMELLYDQQKRIPG